MIAIRVRYFCTGYVVAASAAVGVLPTSAVASFAAAHTGVAFPAAAASAAAVMQYKFPVHVQDASQIFPIWSVELVMLN